MLMWRGQWRKRGDNQESELPGEGEEDTQMERMEDGP